MTEKTDAADSSKTMIKETGVLTIAMYMEQLISVVRGILVASFLGPALYGVWSIFRSFFQTSVYSGLGTSWALARELPFNKGKNESHKSELLKHTTLNFSVLTSLIIAGVTIAYSCLDAAEGFRSEIRLGAVALVLNVIHAYIPQQLRGEKKFFALAKYWLAYSLLNTAIGLALMYPFGIDGLLWGMIITSATLTVILFRSGELCFAYGLDRQILVKAIAIGFPMMFITIAPKLMAIFDRVIIFAMIDSVTTGYYSMAAFFSSLLIKIPSAMAAVLLPRLMYQQARGSDLSEMNHLYDKPMLLQAYLVPVVLGIMVLNIEAFLGLLLPDYLPAVPAFQVLVMGMYFTVMWTIPKGVLIVFNKQGLFMVAVPIFLVLGVIMNYAAIKAGFGMIGVAYASAIFYFLVLLVTNGYALRLLNRSRAERMKTFASIHIPYLYAIVSILLVTRIDAGGSILADSILRSAIFLLCCVPLLWLAEKKLSLTERLRDIFSK